MSVRLPSQDPSHENIIPLESVITDGPSDLENLGRHDSTHASPSRASGNQSWWYPDPSLSGNPSRKWNETLDSQRAVLKRLKAWHQWDTDRYKSLGNFLMSKAGFPKRPICPSDDQLVSLARHFFPPRWSLKVVVCDFGDGRFERCETNLLNVEKCKSLSCSWCDDLTIVRCVRLGDETNVGDCAVDVSFPNSNALGSIDVRRHIPLGSGSLETVRQ